MSWLNLVSYLFGGAVLFNAVPHLVAGVSGRPFQTPFADPPGQGLSSSILNTLWGFLNLVVGYLLVCQVGDFDLKNIADAAALAVGALAIALFSARHFGRFNGGAAPQRP